MRLAWLRTLNFRSDTDMFAQPAPSTMNNLLTYSGGALQRLANFSSKAARFNIAPFSFAYTFQYDGRQRDDEPQLEQRISQLSPSPSAPLRAEGSPRCGGEHTGLPHAGTGKEKS